MSLGDDFKYMTGIKRIDDLDRSGMTQLARAAWDGKLSKAKKFLDHGANIDARIKTSPVTSAFPHSGATVLFCAALNGQTEMATFLIGRGANCDARDDFGYSVMDRLAFERDHCGDEWEAEKIGGMMQLLADAGAQMVKLARPDDIAFKQPRNTAHAAPKKWSV